MEYLLRHGRAELNDDLQAEDPYVTVCHVPSEPWDRRRHLIMKLQGQDEDAMRGKVCSGELAPEVPQREAPMSEPMTDAPMLVPASSPTDAPLLANHVHRQWQLGFRD